MTDDKALAAPDMRLPFDLAQGQLPGKPPLVWLLQGPRLGDNEQVLALGAALARRFGWPAEVKQIAYRHAPAARVPLEHALDHVDRAASADIGAADSTPAHFSYPDLVVSIGRRAAPVARWIKTRKNPAAIHVQLGRYQDHYRDIDLLVSTAQYALPAAPNVLHLTLPVTARPEASLAAAATSFAGRFAALPRPLIGVLAGGPSRPIDFGESDGRQLLERALGLVRATGGTLLVAASPRTPAAVQDLFARDLPAPHQFFPFRRDRTGPNPYLGLLALADAFIVTSDSISMLADAALTGRPLRLFALPATPRPPLWMPSRPLHWLGRRRLQRLERGSPADWLDRRFEAAVRRGQAQPIRHVPILTNRLLRNGLVARLDAEQAGGDQAGAEQAGRGSAGLAGPEPVNRVLADLCACELDMVASRIAALLAERQARIEAENLGIRTAAAAAPATGMLAGGRLAALAPAAE